MDLPGCHLCAFLAQECRETGNFRRRSWRDLRCSSFVHTVCGLNSDAVPVAPPPATASTGCAPGLHGHLLRGYANECARVGTRWMAPCTSQPQRPVCSAGPSPAMVRS